MGRDASRGTGELSQGLDGHELVSLPGQAYGGNHSEPVIRLRSLNQQDFTPLALILAVRARISSTVMLASCASNAMRQPVAVEASTSVRHVLSGPVTSNSAVHPAARAA